MGRIRVRDVYTREFEVDESAMPFWEGRVEILGPVEEPGVEPPSEVPPSEPAPPAAEPEDARPGKTARTPKPAAE